MLNSMTNFSFPLFFTSLFLAGSAMAVDVRIQDSDSTDWEGCGTLTSLDVTSTNVDIISTGTCLGGAGIEGLPFAATHDWGIVETGFNKADDVTVGAAVTLPLGTPSVAVVTPPAHGSAHVVSPGIINYVAPLYDDTIPDDTVLSDNFTYSITDSTPGTAVGTVQVSFKNVDNGASCIETDTKLCATFTSFPSVYVDPLVYLPQGHIHAYGFLYEQPWFGQVGPFDGARKRISISTTPHYFSGVDSPCEYDQPLNNSKIDYSEDGRPFFECVLIPGTFYYLNIKGLENDPDPYGVAGSGYLD